jgi:phasin
MPETPQFEIPAAVRELAERNVEQARAAYAQLMDMAKQAQEMVAKSSGAMAAGTVEIQNRTMRYAQENINASFALAAELARAKDLKDYLEIQTRFAQRQIKIYTEQAQELGRLMSELAQKSQR